VDKDRLIEILPEKTARDLLAVPIKANDGTVSIMVPSGFSDSNIDSLMLAAGSWVKLIYADEADIKQKLNELYVTKSGFPVTS